MYKTGKVVMREARDKLVIFLYKKIFYIAVSKISGVFALIRFLVIL